MVMMEVLLSVALLSGVSAIPPSVRYVESDFGNFFVANGTAMPLEAAMKVLPVTEACECRMRCLVLVGCSAWSFVPLGGGSAECRLSSMGPTHYDLLEDNGATYAFLQSSIDGEYTFKSDGLLYLKPQASPMTYALGKAFCAKIPGHRLGIYKTRQQYEMLNEYWYPPSAVSSLLMDLRPSASGPVFGDGTLLRDTEMASVAEVVSGTSEEVYSFYGAKIRGRLDVQRTTLCQANPLGVPW